MGSLGPHLAPKWTKQRPYRLFKSALKPIFSEKNLWVNEALTFALFSQEKMNEHRAQNWMGGPESAQIWPIPSLSVQNFDTLSKAKIPAKMALFRVILTG